MKKTNYILIVLLLAFSNVNGQNLFSASPPPKKTEKDRPKQLLPANDDGKGWGKGFVMTAFSAVNRGTTDGDYAVYQTSSTSSSRIRYSMENNFGYNLGFSLGFQGPHYGFEVPFTYRVDRFNVPNLSSSSALKVKSFEFGLGHYIKFLKEKHYIVFGGYFALDLGEYSDFHSLGWNIGYGYNFTKRLNLGLRYKYNLASMGRDGNTAISFTPNNYSYSQNRYSRNSYYNSIQLVLRFDIVNTRKLKSNNNTTKINYNTHSVNPVPVVPQKTTIDYSTYSDAALKEALANSKNIDDMQLIQNELDKRKPTVPILAPLPVNEFDKYTNAQLNDLLNTSVAKEDYDGAEKIKNELANRKKTLDNLKVLLDDAVKIEDFDKAAELQEKIKKLEK